MEEVKKQKMSLDDFQKATKYRLMKKAGTRC